MTAATKIEPTPETIMTLFCEAMNRCDLDALLALYEDNAYLIPQPHEQPAYGKATIRQALHSYLSLQPKITFQTRTNVQTGDVAVLRSAWRLTGTGPDGSPLQMAHESTDVARRQPDGGWKFIIDHPFGADDDNGDRQGTRCPVSAGEKIKRQSIDSIPRISRASNPSLCRA